ncbi:MAG: patatin-like phospholipase family protein [Burkholderiales bacterium]|nr:patatin-like phospholipase family protein [Burkholderiales bacterium]
MTTEAQERKEEWDAPAPGDDVCPTPDPVNEEPPLDRFCDIVLTGGVASGVVYPWAIVEIARAFRFRSIGGTSVGAMAAALAAAAEYGRRTGHQSPFEVLRRLPAALGEPVDGKTRMFSLFQTKPAGKRIMEVWGKLGTGISVPELGRAQVVGAVFSVYRSAGVWGALVGLLVAALFFGWVIGIAFAFALSMVLGAALGFVLGIVIAIGKDLLYGVIRNNLGLCAGGTTEETGSDGKRRPGLVEWLHEGIQRSAGLKSTDPPLTFRDLWCAPLYPGGPRQKCSGQDAPDRRSIDLQAITTNVTLGRPYRLPLTDRRSRLYFKRKELEDYFPKVVLDALVRAARPYPPHNTDPPPGRVDADLLELPGSGMPIVVAARLSLSFPLLFSAVPLWALDHEQERGKRDLKRCLFSDGGVSSNFPVHMFDEALPRWPTFGLWLDRRNPYMPEQRIFFPRYHEQGWGDSWNRFDPDAAGPGVPGYKNQGFKYLVGFLMALVTGGISWRDRVSFRLPHVRNRVARLLLKPGEGGLNIAMPRDKILRMAHEYGTKVGQMFVERFADVDGKPSRDWGEQRWVRMQVMLEGLRERLEGFRTSAEWAKHTVPMSQAIREAIKVPPVRDRRPDQHKELTPSQAKSLEQLLAAVQKLEVELDEAESSFSPVPRPELRLRSPL